MYMICPEVSGKQGWFLLSWCFLHDCSRISYLAFLPHKIPVSHPNLDVIFSFLSPVSYLISSYQSDWFLSCLWGCQGSRAKISQKRICPLVSTISFIARLQKQIHLSTWCLCKCPTQWDGSKENSSLVTWQVLCLYCFLVFIIHGISLLSPRKAADLHCSHRRGRERGWWAGI